MHKKTVTKEIKQGLKKMFVFRMASREKESFKISQHSTGLSPWLQRKYTHDQEGTL
jgi:hypothetical protein